MKAQYWILISFCLHASLALFLGVSGWHESSSPEEVIDLTLTSPLGVPVKSAAPSSPPKAAKKNRCRIECANNFGNGYSNGDS
ncbi:hypothetical protein [Bdellovibrio bacteriovorus]|uniref:hypothetical protein n=1 Tax=Bdellovibrio bacteriovorus TaxID=959 RepID=UPI0035A68C6F